MNALEKMVDQLSDDERLDMLRSFKELAETGAVGDCLLRSKAGELLAIFGNGGGVITWMITLASECNRVFARRYIKETWNIEV